MKSDYWIKLYHEVLDDSKMGTLPDRLWRRCIEMFLLAGRFGGMKKDGILPSTNELAWVLRIPPEELELDLKQLQSVGILEPIAGGWLVVHFAERQAAVPADERGKQFRQKHAGKPANITVTQSERYTNVPFVESESESETEEEKEAPPSPAYTSSQTANAVNSFNNNGHARACEALYQRVTNQICIPPSREVEANKSLQAILDYCEGDIDKAVEKCRPVFNRWCSTMGKNGKNYSSTNVTWLERVLETLAPIAEKPDPNDMTSKLARVQAEAERIQRLYNK